MLTSETGGRGGGGGGGGGGKVLTSCKIHTWINTLNICGGSGNF